MNRLRLALVLLSAVIALAGCSNSSTNTGQNQDATTAAETSGADTSGTGADLQPAPDGAADQQTPQPTTYTGYFPVDCQHVGSGTDYAVGPGKSYESLGAVPWNDLKAGDTVRIFWRAEPYREKILLRGQGTAAQPIRVCGVKGPEGQLPVLSGENATTHKDLAFGGWRPMQDLGLITIFHSDYNTKPAHIVVEGLALTGAHPTNSYSGTDEVLGSWSEGAACVWIQEGDYITVRGNTVTGCGNGIFALSKPENEASLVRHVLIEGNQIYGNGVDNSYLQHNLYVQAIDATYQYNYFGRTRSGSLGANLKDRSAGSVVRYNWIEGSARPIDLVEVQEHAPFVIGVPGTDELYRQAFVYGNLIRLEGSGDGIFAVHYGNDSIPENTRKGTLWCFNNTFIFVRDQSDQWRVHVLDLSTPEESAEFFNNVVLIDPATPGATPSELNLMRFSGKVNLGTNLISAGYIDGRSDGDWSVSGKPNMVETALSIAGVVDVDSLVPVANSPALNQSEGLPGALTAHPLLYQYKMHQQGLGRTPCGPGTDLGALERCP